jgi:hypothetical protein
MWLRIKYKPLIILLYVLLHNEKPTYTNLMILFFLSSGDWRPPKSPFLFRNFEIKTNFASLKRAESYTSSFTSRRVSTPRSLCSIRRRTAAWFSHLGGTVRVVPTGRKRPFGRNWFREHLCFSVYPVFHPTHQWEIGWPIGAHLEFSDIQSEISTAKNWNMARFYWSVNWKG